ncbi:MAG: two-component system response regulator NarL [Gammaproteobacteria bacterium]|nr:two-component system response regulator NarL [Gammaproteobacteria bacterium]
MAEPEAPATLVVIDDHPLFRRGVADLIQMSRSLRLAGAASSGAEGVELVRRHAPALVLLDLNMKGMDGIETLKAIKALDVDSRVVMLTVSDHEEDVVAALRAGADGYLLKDMEPEEILAQLEQAAEGRLVISAKLTELLARALRAQPAPPLEALTARERDILRLLAVGKSNKQIGQQLDIAEATVKVHVKSLLKKLRMRSRVEAAVWAVENIERG